MLAPAVRAPRKHHMSRPECCNNGWHGSAAMDAHGHPCTSWSNTKARENTLNLRRVVNGRDVHLHSTKQSFLPLVKSSARHHAQSFYSAFARMDLATFSASFTEALSVCGPFCCCIAPNKPAGGLNGRLRSPVAGIPQIQILAMFDSSAFFKGITL